jgi:hypothetical protein
MKYRTKPVEVEAVQFNKLGDHPAVNFVPKGNGYNGYFEMEVSGGVIKVDPGEFIVTNKWGERGTYDPETFLNSHEPMERQKTRTTEHALNLLNAITDAVREMERCPNDSTQDIWNEALESWHTGLRMNPRFELTRE